MIALALLMAATPVTLDEVRAASRQNLEALRARIDLERSVETTRQARSAILPRVTLSAGASEYFAGPQRLFRTVPTATGGYEQTAVSVPSASNSDFRLALAVDQLIYDGGRWWNQMAQAGAAEEAARGQVAEQQAASELEAVRRFYELVRAQLVLKALESSVLRSEDQLSRAKSLYQAGRLQLREVLDAEVNVGSDRIEVLRQKQAITTAGVELYRWLGRPIAEAEAVPPPVLETPALPPVADADTAIAQARAHRPLLRALDQQARAAGLSVDIARADYFPRLSVQASYSRQSPTADPFFTDPTRQNVVGLGVLLSWDIFSGFATSAAVGKAEADLRWAEESRRQAVVELEGEVRRALGALSTSAAVSELAEKNLKLAQSEAELEEQRFAAGAGSNIEVRNAQVKLTQSSLAQLRARIDLQIAQAALERTVGTRLEVAP